MLELIGKKEQKASGLVTPLTPLAGQNGTNIGITDDISATLPEKTIKQYEFGSKCLLMGWNFYVTLIWALKGCLLCYYNRIT